jgi:hypothetical protein
MKINFVFIEKKKLEFTVYLIHFCCWFLQYNFKDFSLNFAYWQNLEEISPARHQCKYAKNVPIFVSYKIVYVHNLKNVFRRAAVHELFERPSYMVMLYLFESM